MKRRESKLVWGLLVAAWIWMDPRTAVACPDIDGLVDINCDQKLVILTFGDSITYGDQDNRHLGYPGRLKLLLPNARIKNYGVSGEKTPSGRTRARHLFTPARKADYVLILEGVNDYWIEEWDSGDTRRNLLSMRQTAEKTGGVSMLGRLTQVRRSYQVAWVKSVNREISRYTAIDFYSLGKSIIGRDQLHPNAAGYSRMAQRALESLQRTSARERPVDSDFDGLYDFEELRFGTNRFNADSDRDGLKDGDEVYVYNSSPLLSDTDGDGISDPKEVAVGSSPTEKAPSAPHLRSLEAISGPS